jgi:hypothetical protein
MAHACAQEGDDVMAIEPYDVLMAALHGRRAIRRGDLAEAERWFRLAERAAAIAQRLAAVEQADARRRPIRNPL